MTDLFNPYIGTFDKKKNRKEGKEKKRKERK